MSAGKGFGTSPMGFNKNEVNEYIATLSKRISELETEKKEIEKKYESVKTLVDGADMRIKNAEDSAKQKIEQMEAQLKTERKNSESLIDQVDELKRKLKNAGSAGKSGAASGNTDAAEREAAEIIASAEKTAKKTVAAANKTAEEVVAKAKQTAAEIMQSTGGASSSVDLSGFMAQLRDFVDSVNTGCKKLSDKAAEISGSESVPAAEMPDFSAFVAPKADVPEVKTEVPDSLADMDNAFESSSSGGMDEINALLESMAGGGSDNSDDMNGDDMDGSFDFGSMNDDFDKPKAKKPEPALDVNDLIMDAVEADKKAAEETPLQSNLTYEETGEELTSDLSLTVDADDVKSDENAFGLGQSDEMDEMQKLLDQAEATFGGGSSEFEEKTADASESAKDDWSSLQNELDALEKQNSGIAGDIDMSSDTSDSSDDDNSGSDIWSLGNIDMDESDDDDMSSDLFGSF